MSQDELMEILIELFEHQTGEKYEYKEIESVDKTA